MRRRILAGVVVLAIGAAVTLLLEGVAMVVAWEVLMVAAILVVVRDAWPERPRKVPALIGGGEEPLGRPLRVLASLELEIAGAADPRLSGELPLRSRLLKLLHHRAGLVDQTLHPERGRRLLGEPAWRKLAEEDGSLDLDQIEELIDKIEDV